MSIDGPRHEELVQRIGEGALDESERDEFHRLDAERHAFDAMCGGWMPMSPIRLGYEWGDELTHPGAPGISIVVAHGSRVEMDGTSMTLEQATGILAAKGLRMSHGGWTGRAGSVAELAGLEHPASSSPRTDMESETASETDAATTPESVEKNTEHDARPDTVVGANYDLFG